MDGSFYKIEEELQKARKQNESVKGKDTPFRVEFRFKGGSIQWRYYETYNDALNAEDATKLTCSPWGQGLVIYPSSRQIQTRGPRGGWKKYTGEPK